MKLTILYESLQSGKKRSLSFNFYID